jgi:hypothetical protein
LEQRCLLAGPYAPAAGQVGSTALAKDDASIVGWATGIAEYNAGSNVDADFQIPAKALGPAEGTIGDAVSLGRGGRLTLTFDQPIWDGIGPDFAVFENAFDDSFLELGFVEVSSDGVNFFRFLNDSLSSSDAADSAAVDPTEINNLAGKYRLGFGTPFDLEELADVSPLLNVSKVTHVRLVDIVGDGSQTDSSGDPIYDPFPTVGSAGMDVDAVAVMHHVESPLDVVDFEDVGQSLLLESAFSGPDTSGTLVPGPFDSDVYLGSFRSETLSFNNANSPGLFGSWNGFAYSNMTDDTTAGFTNQFASFAGGGAGGSATFGVGFADQGDFFDPPTISRDPSDERLFQSLMVTNTTYAALSMRHGDSFAKKFGGPTGDDLDFFKLTISGIDGSNQVIGAVDFYLADYRFADNSQDYIVDQWVNVDLAPIAHARSLQFSLESTDNEPFGINTPTYFAIDDIVLATPTLLMDIADQEVTESDGANATRIRVSRPDNDTSTPIEVMVTSSDAEAITVPTEVTIPVGSRYAEFPVGVFGNEVVDGQRQVSVDVSADGFVSTSRTLTILDDDVPQLALTLDRGSVIEGASSVATVVRNDADVRLPLTVQISSSHPELAVVNETVRIDAGQSSATFTIVAAEDAIDRPNTTASLTVSAAGYTSANASLDIIDNDQPGILIELESTSYSEADAFPAAGLEDVGRRLLPDSFYDGADLAGGFVSGGLAFNNEFDPTFSSWSGWSYSNTTDTATPGYTNQFSAITGSGANTSDTYAVATAFSGALVPTIRRDPATSGAFRSIDITNTTYAALSMLQGDGFAKQFGGPSGNDTDFFLLTIEGFDGSSSSVGMVDFYLADYRFADNSLDYIVDRWTTVDVSALSDAVELRFGLSSSDVGPFGINTPAYFAVDKVTTAGKTEHPVVTVRRNGVDVSQALEINLSSSDDSEATVPTRVTIPAGQQSVAFPLTIVDDAWVDGNQVVTIRATAESYGSSERLVTVRDDDNAELTLTIAPSEISEADGQARAVLHRNVENTAAALTVGIAADLAGQLAIPSTTAIPPGQRSTEFFFTAENDALMVGDRTVSITASAGGFASSVAAVLIIEDDMDDGGTTPTLAIDFDRTNLSESDARPTVMLEDVGATLSAESFYNGADSAGGFRSGQVRFNNVFDPTFGSWGGWAVSNTTDATTSGFTNQYSAAAGIGANGSATYAIASAFAGGTAPRITIESPGTGQGFESLMITNSTYAALSMAHGDSFAKKFGGISGDEADYFLLTIEGLTEEGQSVGVVDFYLADFRFDDNGQDYIVDQWTTVDVSSLVGATQLAFSLSSSDIGAFGMNTPAYFAVDQIVLAESTAESVTATVTRSGDDLSLPLVVEITNEDATELEMPRQVVIPAGSASAAFPVWVVDDAVADGAVSVPVRVAAGTHLPAAGTLTIADDERPQLTLSPLGIEIDESASMRLVVHRNTQDLSSPLTARITPDMAGLVIPSTVVIPAGVASAFVDAEVIDNDVRDGDRIIAFTASATDFASATASIAVRDDEISALLVSESDDATVISELLGTDEFQIALASQPRSNVFVDVIYSTSDAEVKPARLVFRPDSWDVPQQVIVTGVPDLEVENQESFSIELVVDREQSDALYWLAAEATVDVFITDYQPSKLRIAEDNVGTLVIDEDSGVTVASGSFDDGIHLVANNFAQQITLEAIQQTRGLVQIDASGGDDLVAVEGSRFTSIDGGEGYDRLALHFDEAVDLVGFLHARVISFEEIIVSSDFHSTMVIDLPGLELIGLQAGKLLIRANHHQPMTFLGTAMSAKPVMVGDEFAQLIRSGADYLHVINRAPWQNSLNRWDVNQSGSVTSRDALVIINQLQQEQGPTLPAISALSDFHGLYVDVSGDGRISSLDALLVINELRRVSIAAEAEMIPLSHLSKSPDRAVVDQTTAAPVAGIDTATEKIASFAAKQDAALQELYATNSESAPSEETGDDEAISPLRMPWKSPV